MQIVVTVAKFYKYLPLPDGVQVTEDDLKTKRAKPSDDGTMLMRVSVDKESQTTISLPESEITDYMAGWARKNVRKSRNSAVASYLEEVVMHAAPRRQRRDHRHRSGRRRG